MYFLGFFSGIADFISHPFESLKGGILIVFRALCYYLDTVIYDLIAKLYRVFDFFCNTRLLNSDTVNAISARVGALLGIIMLLHVIVSFVQMLINPDTVTDNEKGAVSVIKKILIVIVMLGVSSSVFNLLFDIQKNVISSGVISKVLLPTIPVLVDDNGEPLKDDAGNDTTLIYNFGGFLAEETFSVFYRIDLDTEKLTDDEVISRINYCKNVLNKMRAGMVTYQPAYSLGYICLDDSIDTEQEVDGELIPVDGFLVSFNPLSIIIGIAIVYFIATYCISVGVRMIQIMILEIISPMAFISYLSPKKDNMFSKWLNIYFSTYIDVFIRVVIINFICMIICFLFANPKSVGVPNFNFFDSINSTSFDSGWKGFIIVLMIVALLNFARKAPDLLKELLPSGGASKIGFGVGAGTGMGTLLGAGAGALGGFIGGQGVGRLSGAAVGLLHGGRKGVSSKSLAESMSGGYGAAKDAALKTEARVAAGGSRFVLPGAQARAARFEHEKSDIESENAYYKAISEQVGAIKERALSKIEKGDYTSGNTVKYNSAKQKVEALKERAKEMDRTKAMSLQLSDFGGNVRDYSRYLTAKSKGGDAAYNFVQNDLARQISSEQNNVKTLEEAAISDYVRDNKADDVVAGSISNLDAIQRSKPSDANAVTFDTSNWGALDSMDKASKGAITANTARLTDNATRGRRARADAGK